MEFTANKQTERANREFLLATLNGQKLAMSVRVSSGAMIRCGIVSNRYRHILIILVKTVAANRLTAAAGARLKVTANLMQMTAGRSAIIALQMVQIVQTLAIRQSVKLL